MGIATKEYVLLLLVIMRFDTRKFQKQDTAHKMIDLNCGSLLPFFNHQDLDERKIPIGVSHHAKYQKNIDSFWK